MKVGFIGLGHMGGPMSRHVLVAGHDLIVHDLRQAAADDLVAAGAAWAATPGETAAGRDIVLTSLPGPRQVEEVLLGQDGLLDGLEPGSLWVDVSTSGQAVADRVRALAEPRGIGVLDAAAAGASRSAQCRSAQCRSAQCRSAQCRSAQCRSATSAKAGRPGSEQTGWR